jgi:hypothetical protein
MSVEVPESHQVSKANFQGRRNDAVRCRRRQERRVGKLALRRDDALFLYYRLQHSFDSVVDGLQAACGRPHLDLVRAESPRLADQPQDNREFLPNLAQLE